MLARDSGVAWIKVIYDERGNGIESINYGIDGELIEPTDRQRAARITRSFDGRGNIVGQEFYGADNKITYKTVNGYDERSNLISVAYLDVNNSPIVDPHDGKVARMTGAYDHRGNRINTLYFGLDGRPVMSKAAGAARTTFRIDELDDTIEVTYFDADDRLIGKTYTEDDAFKLASQSAVQSGNFRRAFELENELARRAIARQAEDGDLGTANLATALNAVAWYALLSGQPDEALAAANGALKLKSEDLVILTNKAHALMFLGRVEEASVVYLGAKGRVMASSGKTWEVVIEEDFAEFRKVGIEHRLMVEIETGLGIARPNSAAKSTDKP